ncbi:MAG: hypothetical protein M5U15_10950 [Kiritimatiellae bacterium]|nr:hypothetical protein [Kiritimatiellia bacterium]
MPTEANAAVGFKAVLGRQYAGNYHARLYGLQTPELHHDAE